MSHSRHDIGLFQLVCSLFEPCRPMAKATADVGPKGQSCLDCCPTRPLGRQHLEMKDLDKSDELKTSSMITAEDTLLNDRLPIPPECILLKAAHRFLTLRARLQWSEVEEMCSDNFRSHRVWSLMVDHVPTATIKNVIDIKANVNEGQEMCHCFEDVFKGHVGSVMCEFQSAGCSSGSYFERIYFKAAFSKADQVAIDGLDIGGVTSDGVDLCCCPAPSSIVTRSLSGQSWKFGAFMTPLILLGYSIDLATADAMRDLDFFDKMLDDNAKGYGVIGKKEMITFKANYLSPRTVPYFYRFKDSLTVDLANGCVRMGFQCCVPGSEGTGTQFVFFDTLGKVREILVMRHNSEQRIWVDRQLTHGLVSKDKVAVTDGEAKKRKDNGDDVDHGVFTITFKCVGCGQ